MKLKYLQTSKEGAKWLKTYYRKNPQLNLSKAVASLKATEKTLQDNPLAGKVFEEYETVHNIPIQGTVFSLLYTVKNDTIWIIDIRDQRGYRSAESLRNFNRELKKLYGI